MTLPDMIRHAMIKQHDIMTYFQHMMTSRQGDHRCNVNSNPYFGEKIK